MITVEEYFGERWDDPEATEQMKTAAGELLKKVNPFLDYALDQWGYDFPCDPDTGTCISGARGGHGDGGFRPSYSVTGGPSSQHRKARGIDVFDPVEVLDGNLTDDLLARFGLYRERPAKTPGWCHLQDVPPGSGHRTFDP